MAASAALSAEIPLTTGGCKGLDGQRTEFVAAVTEKLGKLSTSEANDGTKCNGQQQGQQRVPVRKLQPSLSNASEDSLNSAQSDEVVIDMGSSAIGDRRFKGPHGGYGGLVCLERSTYLMGVVIASFDHQANVVNLSLDIESLTHNLLQAESTGEDPNYYLDIREKLAKSGKHKYMYNMMDGEVVPRDAQIAYNGGKWPIVHGLDKEVDLKPMEISGKTDSELLQKAMKSVDQQTVQERATKTIMREFGPWASFYNPESDKLVLRLIIPTTTVGVFAGRIECKLSREGYMKYVNQV